MTKDVIDLRSDTVTLPTEAMYYAMSNALVGDDGLDGDPTVRLLEEAAAELLGKERSIFVPSCTMANLLAMMIYAPRCSRILLGSRSHVWRAEQGGLSLCAAMGIPVPDTSGCPDAKVLDQELASNSSHLPNRLVMVETSHNDLGGRVAPIADMQKVHALAGDAGIPVHLDGARLFNASIHLGVPPVALAACADTVAICLSKGLSAPAGALLCGPSHVILEARRFRRLLGGQQRQIGVIAATGLIALNEMIDRLAEDHVRARRLASGLAAAVPEVSITTPQTNIVLVDVSSTGLTGAKWTKKLRDNSVLVRPWGFGKIRAVLHRHITDAMIDQAVEGFRTVADLAVASNLRSANIMQRDVL